MTLIHQDYLPSAEVVLRMVAANIRGERVDWSFDTFPRPGGTLDKVKHWVHVRTGLEAGLPGKRGAVLYGPTGVGKTGMAVSAIKHWVLNGQGIRQNWEAVYGDRARARRTSDRPWMAPIWFEWWPDMYERFARAARVFDPLEDEDRPDVPTLLQDYHLDVETLVIDDLDLGEYTPFKETLLLRLLQMFEKKKTLIVTMNRGPVDGVPVLGERVVDRLFSDRFFCVHVTGGSLRKRRSDVD